MNAKELFLTGRKLTPKDARKSPYTYNAIKHSLPNYSLITNEFILKNKLEPGTDLPKHIWHLLMEQGEVLALVNPIRWEVPQLLLRSLKERRFSVFGSQGAFFYGQGLIPQDFKFGTPLLLVEGPLDRDSIQHIYPYTLAIMSANLSLRQRTIISYMTDKVILGLDNDKTGHSALRREQYAFRDLHIQTRVLEHPPHVKDCGTLAELAYSGLSFEHDALEQEYKLKLNILLNSF